MPVSRSVPILLILSALASCATAPRPEPAVASAYLEVANGYFDQKKYEKASAAYDAALKWNPDLTPAAVNGARALAEAGKTAEALERLAPLAARYPDNPVILQYRAWLTARKDGPAAAADLYLSLSRLLAGDASAQYNTAVCLKAAGRLAESAEAWAAWKLLDGKLPAGLAAAAEVLAALGRPEAAEAWSDAAAAYPDNDAKRFGPLSGRARSLSAAEDWTGALAAWDAALALPSAADQSRAEAKFRRGEILLVRLGDPEAGTASVIQAWKDGFQDPAAWKAMRSVPTINAAAFEAALAQAEVKP